MDSLILGRTGLGALQRARPPLAGLGSVSEYCGAARWGSMCASRGGGLLMCGKPRDVLSSGLDACLWQRGAYASSLHRDPHTPGPMHRCGFIMHALTLPASVFEPLRTANCRATRPAQQFRYCHTLHASGLLRRAGQSMAPAARLLSSMTRPRRARARCHECSCFDCHASVCWAIKQRHGSICWALKTMSDSYKCSVKQARRVLSCSVCTLVPCWCCARHACSSLCSQGVSRSSEAEQWHLHAPL